MPQAPTFLYRWSCRSDKTLDEIPPLAVRFAGRNLPVAGGGYLRILPMWYARWALGRIGRRDGRSSVVYIHPWEVDRCQLRMVGSLKSRLRHCSNLRRVEARINELLARVKSTSPKSFLENHLAAGLVTTAMRP
jgi:hypothetical protein